MFDGLQLVLDQFDEEKQIFVDEEDFVLGMIQDVDEMMHGQAES